jgi:Transglycosylase-like domain
LPFQTRRLRAVAVATLATAVLLVAIAPAATFAKEPPGLARFMNAIAKVESGGRYTAQNTTSGAYGKYQIMPSNWPTWARQYLGDAHAAPTPANQEKVATAKFRALYAWLGSWRRVAYWWLTGSDATAGWSAASRLYVEKVMTAYKTASSTMPTAAKSKPKSGSSKPTHHYGETSSRVAYHGSWHSARLRSYAGGAVRYATKAGASATVTFTGSRITWFGPVGPTRGKARILVDGVAVRTVDLHRSGFKGHAALYARTWPTKGTHTLTIQVVGTKHHPMVAIDEFVVRG